MKNQKYEELVKQAMATGGFSAAVDYLDDCIEKNPNLPEAYLVRGEIYTEMENFREALVDFEKAIKINPNIAISYYSRGILYAKSGKDDKALNDFNKAIELDANYTEAYTNRANMFLKSKKYQQAINDCTKAIELMTGNGEKDSTPYYNRGLAYINMGEVKKALEDYNKVIELSPENAEAYAKRGSINQQLGNAQEAIRDFEKFLELDPGNANAKLVKYELEKLKRGDTSSSDDSYEVFILKKDLKFILIGSIIGAVAGTLVYGLLIGGFSDILYILVGVWAGIGWGGSINLVPSFFRAGRTISASNAGVIGVLAVILWFFLSTFSGIIWPLIRILIKVFKIKKLQRNGC